MPRARPSSPGPVRASDGRAFSGGPISQLRKRRLSPAPRLPGRRVTGTSGSAGAVGAAETGAPSADPSATQAQIRARRLSPLANRERCPSPEPARGSRGSGIPSIQTHLARERRPPALPPQAALHPCRSELGAGGPRSERFSVGSAPMAPNLSRNNVPPRAAAAASLPAPGLASLHSQCRLGRADHMLRGEGALRVGPLSLVSLGTRLLLGARRQRSSY